jgi:hypothetical protein
MAFFVVSGFPKPVIPSLDHKKEIQPKSGDN